MNYLEMREEEWPIGSGMVESGGKQYKARFCRVPACAGAAQEQRTSSP